MPPVALEQRIRKFACGYLRILVVTCSRVNGSISPDTFGSAAAPGLNVPLEILIRFCTLDRTCKADEGGACHIADHGMGWLRMSRCKRNNNILRGPESLPLPLNYLPSLAYTSDHNTARPDSSFVQTDTGSYLLRSTSYSCNPVDCDRFSYQLVPFPG